MRMLAIILASSVVNFTASTLANGYTLLNARRVTKEVFLENPDADGWFTVVDREIPGYRIEFSENGDVVNWGHENARPNDVLLFPDGYFRVDVANPNTLSLSKIENPGEYPRASKQKPKRILWIGGWHRVGKHLMRARFDAKQSKLIVSVFNKGLKVSEQTAREGDALTATDLLVSRVVRPDEMSQRIGWIELNAINQER